MYHPHNRRTSPTEGPSLIQQNFKDETDINLIVGRAFKTGQPPMTNLGRPGASRRQPIYGDFSSVDHLEMRNAVASREVLFAGLPARIRARFKGDVYQLMLWVEDPKNHDEAVKLGLLVDPPRDLEAAVAEFNESTREAPKADPEANPDYGKK